MKTATNKQKAKNDKQTVIKLVSKFSKKCGTNLLKASPVCLLLHSYLSPICFFYYLLTKHHIHERVTI